MFFIYLVLVVVKWGWGGGGGEDALNFDAHVKQLAQTSQQALMPGVSKKHNFVQALFNLEPRYINKLCSV